MNLAIVTLSRQLASGGDAIALGVAQAMGLRMVDRHVINQAAVEAGVPRVALEELGYEGQRSLVERMLGVVSGMPTIPTMQKPSSKDIPVTPPPFGSLVSPLHPPMNLFMPEYVRMVGMVIRNLARDGKVIIVGQGGQMVLQGVTGVLHVQVMASLARRVATLAAREGIDRREATGRLRASDRARANYLQRYHGADWQDATLYDMILNTDGLPVSVGVAAVVGACRSMDEQPDEAVEGKG